MFPKRLIHYANNRPLFAIPPFFSYDTNQTFFRFRMGRDHLLRVFLEMAHHDWLFPMSFSPLFARESLFFFYSLVLPAMKSLHQSVPLPLVSPEVHSYLTFLLMSRCPTDTTRF